MYRYIGQGAHKLCIEGQAFIFVLSHISNGDAVIGGPDVSDYVLFDIMTEAGNY